MTQKTDYKTASTATLDVLRRIESGDLTAQLCWQQPGAGAAYRGFEVSNGWRLVVLVGASGWMNIDRVSDSEDNVFLFNDMSPELQGYVPPAEVLDQVYGIGASEDPPAVTASMPPQDVALDIVQDDHREREVICWAGMKDSSTRPGYVNFEVHERIVETVDGKPAVRLGALVLAGHMQARGLTTIEFIPAQWDQFAQWQHHMALLGNIYVRAHELMGCAPDPRDVLGHGAYMAACQVREDMRVQAAIDKAVAGAQLGQRSIGVSS